MAVRMKGCVYLQAENITQTRLASFDRAIKSEPHFEPEQCKGLLKDLKAYLITLKARYHMSDVKCLRIQCGIWRLHAGSPGPYTYSRVCRRADTCLILCKNSFELHSDLRASPH